MSWGGILFSDTSLLGRTLDAILLKERQRKTVKYSIIRHGQSPDAILTIQSPLRPLRGCLEAAAFLDLSYWTRASAHVIVAPILCSWNGLRLSRTWTNWHVSNMENGSPSCLSLVIKTYRILYTCAQSYDVNRLMSVVCVGYFFCFRLSSLMSISNALESSAVQSA